MLDVLAADDEHAARAAGGVINLHSGCGLDDPDHEANDIARGVEVAAFFAGRLGEHVDEELIGRPQQVGELEVFVQKRVSAEVANQLSARFVGHDPLVPLGAHEADVIEDVFQRLVLVAQGAECRVEDLAVRLRRVVEALLQVWPAGARRHEEIVKKVGILAILRFGVISWSRPR